jgi:conjugative transposon TraM protein
MQTNMEQQTQKRRKRQFLLVLPLLIIPFLTMIFWALGGGKGNAGSTKNATASKGLNTAMPNPVLKSERGLTKMSFYDLMALDSMKMKEREKNDPFFHTTGQNASMDVAPTPGRSSKYGGLINAYSDPNEAKVYEKLAQLTDAMHRGETEPGYGQLPSPPVGSQPSSPEIARLDQMVHSVQAHSGEDTEIQRLNSMMDKIIAVQHPEAAKDTSKPVIVETNKVSVKENTVQPGVLQGTDDTTIIHNGFYSLDEEKQTDAPASLVRAVVPETQTIVAGSTIKLLLADDITAKGVSIPKNTFVHGVASLGNERLKITITSVRCGSAILPVALEVYDLDGLAGIYVPGSINRDVAKESTDNAVNSVGLTTLDPSLAAQATTAGIAAAKTLISKKVRLVKVTLPAGYSLFLQNKKQ